MSQNDFNLANQGFPSMRADMNSALQALASNSSGATSPATTYAYQWWYDDANDILKFRNADNDAWIDFATFNQATDSWFIPGTLKVDNITDEEGTGAPNFPNGIANGFLQKGAPIYITTSGTYTPSAGTRAIFVEVQGAGAGGGSVSGSESQAAVGGGGGAGGFTEKFITPLEASYTVVIGAGGSGGGNAGAENGSDGGQSSFVGASVDMVASGGQGGTGRDSSTAILQASGGRGGSASGGDLNVRGGRGTRGGMVGPVALGHPDGANSFFGSGGSGPAPSGSADSRNSGSAGEGFGSGGSGAAVINANVNRPGGNGADGLIIIREYE